MKRMLMWMMVAGLVPAALPGAEEGWEVIYDGKDLSKVETAGNWQIQEDGSLYLEPREGEKGWQRYDAYLKVRGDYADFVFDFEYMHEEGGNSGLYFRVTDEADPVASGFEVQILDCFGKEGELTHHDLGGVIKTAGPLANASKPPGEWNRMVVTLQGSLLTVEINGVVVQDALDVADKKPAEKELAPSGKISIQDHGQKFRVRNLRVKRLG